MTELDGPHLEAAAYANMRKMQYEEANPVPTYTPEEYSWIWLAHYEGYIAGIASRERGA